MKRISVKKAIATVTAIATISTSAMSIAGTTISASAATVGTNITTSKTGDLITVSINLNTATYLNSFNLSINIGNGFDFYGNNASATCAVSNPITFVSGKTLGITTASNDSVKVKNSVITFKMKANKSLNSNNNKITYNVDSAISSSGDVQISGMSNTTLKTGYTRGDVNADKTINSSDSVLILQALDSHMLSSVPVSGLNHGYLDDWFPKISSAEAADANVDGYISKEDSDTILKAYSSMLVNTYTGTVGKTYSVVIK